MYTYLLVATMLAQGAAAKLPQTWYVRADGGSAAQCDGMHDAPYASAARHHACAWRHPFDALPPDGPPRLRGGDTLVIGAGSYMMGAGAPGTDAFDKCRQDWPWDCHMVAVPSGPSADHPTRILGAGFDAGCRKPPELWGAERSSSVLNLEGSSNVEVACLEITDHSSCIEFHKAANATDRCERDKAPFGNWASVGVNASDSSNVQLRDLDIHGLAHDGVRAGRLRDWTLERVRIVGNGWSGWNGDIGGTGSSDSGRMVFRNVEIAWNGCGEKYPDGAHFGCWGQESGGYGDGLGTGETGGDWTFDHVNVHHNTQDGIDLLHATAQATIEFRDVHAEANAGNQIKATGSVTIQNSTVIGSCRALQSDGLDAADACRAYGNSIALFLPANARSSVVNNEIQGEGDCLIDLECGGDGCRSASAVVKGNRLNGRERKQEAAEKKLPCSLWVQPELRGASIDLDHNTIRSTRPPGCPAGVRGCARAD
jgi:hypothetical protein